MEKVIRTLSSQGLIPSGDVFMLRSVTGLSQEPVLKHQVPAAFTLFYCALKIQMTNVLKQFRKVKNPSLDFLDKICQCFVQSLSCV